MGEAGELQLNIMASQSQDKKEENSPGKETPNNQALVPRQTIGWQVWSIGATGLIAELTSLFANAISTLALPIVPEHKLCAPQHLLA
ncbi:hypothetical protein RJ641_017981 [Dillenia turbinata]|uniref:Uncharacterized protein n=1 Tax=Dillenia turbinata TaxID=194707 RepID=A0AAN8UKL3_9MAGN